jgi:ATP-binding cassette, subfamily B, bacterial
MNKKLPNKPIAFAVFFLKDYRWPLLLMFLLEAIQAGCQIMFPYAIKQIIDVVTSFSVDLPRAQAYELLKSPVYLFVGLSFGILFAGRASGALLVWVGPSLRKKARFSIYKYLQDHSHRYFVSQFAGSLANRINEVSVGINHALWTVMFDFWPVAITFSVSLFLLFQVSSSLAIYLAVWILGYVSVSIFLAAKARHYAQRFAAARSFVGGKFVDAVTNILNTKMFARRKFEQDDIVGHLDYVVKAARDTFWFMEKMRWFQYTAAIILQVGALVMSIGMWLDGLLTVGGFTMVTSLSLLIINDAKGLSRRFLDFFEYVGNITDGVSVIVQPHEIIDHPKAFPLKVAGGEIAYAHVNFKYEDGKEVFKNLNVVINPGERVGLVGFSGSGKSTFVNLLTRLYEIQSGSITVDSQDVSKVTQDSLRQSISMIPQDPMLFHRSLMENIRYGNVDASDQDVIAAAKKAMAHEFIMELPEAYKSLVGERGVKLSGGQRQRIAIARAILKNAPILVLDEATSSLDSVTENLIQEGFELLMKGKTVIAVAHRLSTISHMDRILVFDQGEIVEQGTHAELIKSKGHYEKLWSMQVGGFLPLKEQGPEVDLGLL